MSLFDQLSSNSNKRDSSDNANQTSIATMNSQQLIASDLKIEDELKDHAVELHRMKVFGDQLVRSIYKVADYVPDLTVGAHKDIWKNKLLPELKKALIEDVKSRSVTVKVISTIRDLAITIQKCGEIVHQTKGSATAVGIARKNIEAALNNLDNAILAASRLENHAIDLFAQQTEKIFEMIGSDAANFIKQKADVDLVISDLEQRKRKIYDEISRRKGKIDGLSNLIHVTETRVNGANQALEATRQRCQEMSNLNASIDRRIQSIPDTVVRTTRHNFWLFGWTTIHNVKNTDKDAQRNYYESVMLARDARLKATNSEANKIDSTKAELEKELSQLKAQYKKNTDKLTRLMKDFDTKIKSLDKQIELQYKKLEDLDKQQSKVEGMLGLKGNATVECLLAVRGLSLSMKSATEMYAPLISILQSIKVLVESDVELLLKDDIAVFLAGGRLLNQVGFLASYSTVVRQLASTPTNQITAPGEFRMLGHDDDNIVENAENKKRKRDANDRDDDREIKKQKKDKKKDEKKKKKSRQ